MTAQRPPIVANSSSSSSSSASTSRSSSASSSSTIATQPTATVTPAVALCTPPHSVSEQINEVERLIVNMEQGLANAAQTGTHRAWMETFNTNPLSTNTRMLFKIVKPFGDEASNLRRSIARLNRRINNLNSCRQQILQYNSIAWFEHNIPAAEQEIRRLETLNKQYLPAGNSDLLARIEKLNYDLIGLQVHKNYLQQLINYLNVPNTNPLPFESKRKTGAGSYFAIPLELASFHRISPQQQLPPHITLQPIPITPVQPRAFRPELFPRQHGANPLSSSAAPSASPADIKLKANSELPANTEPLAPSANSRK